MATLDWQNNLLISLRNKTASRQLIADIDEVLIWLKGFDSNDAFTSQCISVEGSEIGVKRATLRYIDVLLLQDSDDVINIFGNEPFSQKSTELLKRRYKRLTAVFHPDRAIMSVSWLNERMSVINKAYDLACKVIAGEIELPNRTNTSSNTPDVPYRQSASAVHQEYSQQQDWLWSYAYPFAYKLVNETNLKALSIKLIVALLVLIGLVGFLRQMLSTPTDVNDQQVDTNVLATANESSADWSDLSDDDVSRLVDELLAKTSTADNRAAQNRVANMNRSYQMPKTYEPELGGSVLSQENDMPTTVTSQPNTDTTSQLSADKMEKEAAVVTQQVTVQPQVDAPKTAKSDKPERRSVSELARSNDEPHKTGNKTTGSAAKTKTAEVRTLATNSVSVDPVNEVVVSFTEAFNDGAADRFSQLFMSNAVYFGTKGRSAIKRERASFFNAMDSQEVVFNISSRKQFSREVVLRGDMIVMFNIRNSSTVLCIPTSMFINLGNDNQYSIKSVVRTTAKTWFSRCEKNL